MSKVRVSAVVNGEPVEFLGGTRQSLLDALRDELGLTGSKEGCGTGDCGACSITLDGTLVCSCLVLAPEAQGRRIETIEGMAVNGVMHPLQQQFLEHAAGLGSEVGIAGKDPGPVLPGPDRVSSARASVSMLPRR